MNMDFLTLPKHPASWATLATGVETLVNEEEFLITSYPTIGSNVSWRFD